MDIEKIIMTELAVPDMNDSFTRYKIDGKEYQLRFTWNDTNNRWYFGVYNAFREPIIQGIKVVPMTALNRFCGTNELLGFVFMVLTEKDVVGRDDFKTGAARFVYGRYE